MSVSRYIEKLASRLFSEQSIRDAFVNSLLSPIEYPNAIIWLGERSLELKEIISEREEWQPDFVDRVMPQIRLGSSDLHQQGEIYILDFSSVFEASVLSGVNSKVTQVLDVCSAPGGKGIFAWRLFKPDFMLCNEVIHKRSKALISDLKRCKVDPVGVSGFDSSVLPKRYSNSFDLVVVDAPCSGQSLLAKGDDNPGAFHPLTIKRNANRQRRILANSQGCVSAGGYLAYMTCTYSIEENEGVIDWFVKKFPQFSVVKVDSLAENLSPYTDYPCYRIWPQDGLGAGGFTALLKKEGEETAGGVDLSSQKFFWKSFD